MGKHVSLVRKIINVVATRDGWSNLDDVARDVYGHPRGYSECTPAQKANITRYVQDLANQKKIATVGIKTAGFRHRQWYIKLMDRRAAVEPVSDSKTPIDGNKFAEATLRQIIRMCTDALAQLGIEETSSDDGVSEAIAEEVAEEEPELLGRGYIANVEHTSRDADTMSRVTVTAINDSVVGDKYSVHHFMIPRLVLANLADNLGIMEKLNHLHAADEVVGKVMTFWKDSSGAIVKIRREMTPAAAR